MIDLVGAKAMLLICGGYVGTNVGRLCFGGEGFPLNPNAQLRTSPMAAERSTLRCAPRPMVQQSKPRDCTVDSIDGSVANLDLLVFGGVDAATDREDGPRGAGLRCGSTAISRREGWCEA